VSYAIGALLGASLLEVLPEAVQMGGDIETVAKALLGGILLFFTDGLNEAVDESGEQFGLERVLKLLQASRGESAKGICGRLWDAVKEYSRAAPHQDDFAVLLMKRAPSVVKSVDLTKPIYW